MLQFSPGAVCAFYKQKTLEFLEGNAPPPFSLDGKAAASVPFTTALSLPHPLLFREAKFLPGSALVFEIIELIIWGR